MCHGHFDEEFAPVDPDDHVRDDRSEFPLYCYGLDEIAPLRSDGGAPRRVAGVNFDCGQHEFFAHREDVLCCEV